MRLFMLPLFFLSLTSCVLCSKITKGLCPRPHGDFLVEVFSDNNLTHITKEMFESCNHLKKVVLIFGDTTTYKIDSDSFENLKNLKTLYLLRYKIPHLKKGFFRLTPSIAEIHLLIADIEEIDSDAFEDFKDLEMISINSNEKWKHLPENLFRNLKKLREIDLSYNNLEDLTWEEFKGLTNVKILNLSSNNISSFDAENISKFMPNLEYIRINNNPIECKNKRAFAEELKKKLNTSVEVWYKHPYYVYPICQEDD